MPRQATPDLLGEPLPADDPSLGAMFPTSTGSLVDVREIPLDQITICKRLRNLDIEKARDIALSVECIGLLEPLVVREDGTLIAGRHRLEALRILGWQRAPVRVMVLSDLDAELAEIDENLIRNELTVLQRGEHLARRKEIYEALHPKTKRGAMGGGRNGVGVRVSTENENISFSVDTAGKIGVSPRTIQHEVKIASGIADDVREAIGRPSSKTYDTPLDKRLNKLADSKSELLYLAKMEHDKQRAVLDHIVLGANTVKEAERQIYEESLRTAVSTLQTPWLLIGDFREVARAIPDASVDLIFTDPPYDEVASALYGDLAALGARVLKPGGILLTYSGQMHLPKIYDAMGQHLQYMWTCAIGHANGATWFRKWHLLNEWKPVLMYGKPPVNAWWLNSFADFVSGGKEKDSHPWQQSLAEAQHYIAALCPAGGIVLDPFLGSGTTAVAAKGLGMQYIGIEKDAATAQKARGRIEEA